MRWIVMCLVVVAGGLVGPGVFAGDPAEKPAQAEDIAVWIRHGSDADVERAARAAAGRDEAGLRAIFQAVRAQTRIVDNLRKKRVRNLTWEETSLDTALVYLNAITGMNFYVTPRVRTEKLEDVQINVTIDDVAVSDVLDVITKPFELRWVVKHGAVIVAVADELSSQPAPALRTPADLLRKKIQGTRMSLSVRSETKFADVLKTMQVMTGLNIVLDPRVAAEFSKKTVIGIELRDAPMATTLDLVVAQLGEANAVWTTRGNIILVTTKELLRKK